MRLRLGTLAAGVLAVIGGCHSHDPVQFDSAEAYLPFVQQIEYADADVQNPPGVNMLETQPPPSARRPEDLEKWPLTLEQTIELALANSQVIRDVGGRVVSAPSSSSTIYDPAIQEANPRLGPEAALAAFDAQFTTRLYLEQTDRAFNNLFFGAGTRGLLSHLGDFQMGVTKTAATGTQFTLENLTTYNRNLSPANLFPGAYDTVFQAGFRHPLLQGGGLDFNRIAGPNATVGNYNGVLIARVNSDISLADFETNVRNLLNDVERTYWELYFAYRDLDAKMAGRRLALDSWELEKRRADAGVRTSDQEAFARQQYYAAQAAVENALSGTSSGVSGVYATERQLRSLLGLPTSDGRLIVPADEPANVDVRFDWYESLASALTRRVELRRQQWTVKRRELELTAAHNFEKMRLDFVGQYRWRGFGDDLLGSNGMGNGSAFESLLQGDLQDWRVGVELTTPVGNRTGHAAVRHAEFQLAREHALYDEMERQVSHELRGAFTELDRAYVVTRSRYNERVAAFTRLRAEQLRNERGQTDLDLVLDAQRAAVEAESSYYRALIDYNEALLSLHRARGTLLDYHNVALTEGPWSAEAHQSAAKLARRFRPKCLNYCLTWPGDVSRGEYPQEVEEVEVAPLDVPTPATEPLERLPEPPAT